MSNKLWKRICIVSFVTILQVLVMFWVGSKKEGYHIDEMYSYILANSYDAGAIDASADWMWGKWIPGETFDEFLTVQPGEEFSYKTVYYNTSTDCHPPLYYWFLHAVCSFFPGEFSKWYGLGLNMVLFVLANMILYGISEMLIESPVLKLLPVTLYGFSVYAIDTCVYIRMYMLLTVWVLLFIFLHIKMFQEGVTWFWIFMAGLVVYLGAMTQYYFIIFAFWAVLFFVLFLLSQKRIANLFEYGFCCLFGVLVMFASFPYAISQATGSATNNVGNEVSANLFNVKLGFNMLFRLARDVYRHFTYYTWGSRIVLGIFAILFLVCIIVSGKKNTWKEKERKEILWMSGIFAVTFVSISFIGGQYVFIRYVYYLMPILFLIGISFLDMTTEKETWMQKGIAIFLSVVFLGNCLIGTWQEKATYLYSDEAVDELWMKAKGNRPLLMIVDEIRQTIPTGNIRILQCCSSIYMDTFEAMAEKNLFAQCFADGKEYLLYIPTDTEWVNGYEEKTILDALLDFHGNYSYSIIANGEFGDFYCIMPPEKKNS